MASKQRSVEEIIGKASDAEVALAQGETVAQACRGIGVSDHTFYRWRQQYGGLRIDQRGGCGRWKRRTDDSGVRYRT